MSHQVSGIVHLPQDVLLELAKQLDVADLMSVLATCRLIRELRLQRSLWIEALARIKAVQMQPLPFTNTDEIGTLSLHQLQDIVQRVEHLINNFQSDNPRPVRIRTLSLAASIDTIFCIPGANLAVSHTIGTVCVWDILTSHRVGYLEVPDLIVHPRALCLEIKGQALIGASISRDAANLVAICIDYRDRAHISMSHVISSNVNPALSTGFFITSRVLGFCSGNRIAFWSMVPGEGVHFIPGDIYRPVTLFSPASLCCQPVGGSLYILCYPLIGEDTTVQTLPVPFVSANQHSGPSSDRSELDLINLDIPFRQRQYSALGTTSTVVRGPAHVFAPEYGVFAVAFAIILADNQWIGLIHFYPVDVVDGKLHFGEACVYEHDAEIRLHAVGASGTYVLLAVLEGGGYLGLLHFSATPLPHTTFRKLDTGDLSVASCTRVALDEALGLVLAVDDVGKMTAISYM